MDKLGLILKFILDILTLKWRHDREKEELDKEDKQNEREAILSNNEHKDSSARVSINTGDNK